VRVVAGDRIKVPAALIDQDIDRLRQERIDPAFSDGDRGRPDA
jgi:hypothetical protein